MKLLITVLENKFQVHYNVSFKNYFGFRVTEKDPEYHTPGLANSFNWNKRYNDPITIVIDAKSMILWPSVGSNYPERRKANLV